MVGQIGIEMAQAFRRLGSEVTVIEKFGILARDDRKRSRSFRESLRREGVQLVEGLGVSEVRRADGALSVILDGETAFGAAITGTHLLIAAGRRPISNLSGSIWPG